MEDSRMHKLVSATVLGALLAMLTTATFVGLFKISGEH
jgi:hypothetical protein